MKSLKGDPVELALSALLDVLAAFLIEVDVTPARLSQIARASFVKAGALDARKLRSGRPHLALIAARTGLSRTEVKRLVVGNYDIGTLMPEQSPRALRVFSAWRSQNPYSINGRPRALKLAGTPPSFESLCKEFSGDIPYRVILNELKRRGLAHVLRGGCSVAISRAARGRPSPRDVQQLTYGAAFLTELLQSDAVLVRRKERIFAPTSIAESYVEKAVVGRVTALLDQIPQIFSNRQPATKKRRPSVNVYALVTSGRKRMKGKALES